MRSPSELSRLIRYQWLYPTAENDQLVTEIRRVEKAIQALEVPTHIAKDCLSNRQRRIDNDLVQDNAENQLLKVGLSNSFQ